MTSNISSNGYSGHKIERYSDNRHRSTYEKENTSKSLNSADVSRCSIRERLIHLLAVRPFSKLELTSRLQKEGIRNHERSSINSILMAIAQLRNQIYNLRVHMWYYVNENWPFYTEEEQDQVKRNKPRDPTPTDNSTTGSSCEVSKNINTSAVSCCHIRERLIHLLALKPFSKVELFSRLQKEGIRDDDRSSIKSILMDIASVRNNIYSLRGHVWEDVNGNWPFYTEDEQNQVKRNKPQDLSPPHNSNDSSSCGSLSPLSSPPQQIDSLEYEYLPPPKKQRISRVGPNSKHVVASSNPIGSKIGNSTTQFSSHSTKKDSAYQNNFYTYPSDNTNRVLVSSNSINSNIIRKNPTHCNNHWTKNDSKDQVNDNSRSNCDKHTANSDVKQHLTEPQRDLPKRKGSLTESAAPAERKSYTLIDMFGDNINPTKRTAKGGSHKKKAINSDPQQQTQPQRNLPEMTESLTEPVAPATKKEYRLTDLFGDDIAKPPKKTTNKFIDLFGDDIATPPKMTTNDRTLKRKATDHNLQQEQPQRNLPEITESLAETMTAAPRKEYKLIDLFGDDIATPTKVTTNHRALKTEATDHNLCQQKPERNLPEMTRSLAEPVAPAAKKEYNLIDLFGDDVATPTKVWKLRHKKKSSDQKLQRQTQAQLHLSKKDETLTKSASLEKKHRLIELFGED